METLLHIEPITRAVTAPFSIGYNDILRYGDALVETGYEDLVEAAAETVVGCPLQDVVTGQAPTRTYIPLMKTTEVMADSQRGGSPIYLETLHYLHDQAFLIPVRSKIHTGHRGGMRFSHLPNLNFVRGQISNAKWEGVKDVREECLGQLLENDLHFQRNEHHPVIEWLQSEMPNILEQQKHSTLTFDKEDMDQMFQSFMNRVRETPYDLGKRHLQTLVRGMGIDSTPLPTYLDSSDIVSIPLISARRRAVKTPAELGSLGTLKIRDIPGLEHNPFAFLKYLNLIDGLLLTDFNIDVIVQPNNSISFYHDHYAANRLSVFQDHDLSGVNPVDLLTGLVNEVVLADLIRTFYTHHSFVDGRIRDIIQTEPVKLKLIKTITDEALILLFRHDSTDKDDALCGVYFDIALMSLSPMSVVRD